MTKKRAAKPKKPAKSGEKRGPGRPPWEPTPQILRAIEDNAKLGLYDHQIARRVRMDPKIFSERKQRFEEIRDALEIGRADAIAEYSEHLRNQSEQGKTQATMFFLRVHGGWRDNAIIAERSSGSNSATLSQRILAIVRGNSKDGGGGSGERNPEDEVQK